MPQLRRITIPGLPYLVTARGNAGQRLFFDDSDYALYRDPLSRLARKAGLDIWAWAALPATLHMIAVPR